MNLPLATVPCHFFFNVIINQGDKTSYQLLWFNSIPLKKYIYLVSNWRKSICILVFCCAYHHTSLHWITVHFKICPGYVQFLLSLHTTVLQNTSLHCSKLHNPYALQHYTTVPRVPGLTSIFPSFLQKIQREETALGANFTTPCLVSV